MAHLESNRRGSAPQLARLVLNGRFGTRVPRTDAWLPAAMVVLALVAWEWGVAAGVISALFFPPPSDVVRTLIKLTAEGELLPNLGTSLGRLLLGVLLGGVPGLLMGLLMGWSRPLQRALDPFIAALHPLPKIAILPLIMVIFGIGESSKIIVAATGAFFPMLVNTMSGVRQIHRIHFEVAHNYGARPLKVFTRVVLPGSLPFMLTGLLLALNVTLLLTIAVEMVSGRTGLGAMIWLAWETMRVEELYASLTVITLFGIGFNVALHRLTQWLIPWQVDRER